VATEASKSCSNHVGAAIRVALSPAPKKVFEFTSACMCIRRATSKNSRGSHRPMRPWRRPHSSPVHRENGPVFLRTDNPLKLLELIRLRVLYFIRSLRFDSSAYTTSSSANCRWKVLENSARDVFLRQRPRSMRPRNAASCRAISRVTVRPTPGAARCPVSASDCATYSAED
jgi:hypothetical protein